MDEVSSLPNSLHLWDEINNHVLPHVCCFLLIIMSLSGKKTRHGQMTKTFHESLEKLPHRGRSSWKTDAKLILIPCWDGGGATEHGPMGRNLQGGVQQRRGFDKNEESKMTTPDFGELWVAGSTAENHVRGDNGTLWFAVRPLGVYLDIEDVCPSTIWSWQKLAINIRIWSVCCCEISIARTFSTDI